MKPFQQKVSCSCQFVVQFVCLFFIDGNLTMQSLPGLEFTMQIRLVQNSQRGMSNYNAQMQELKVSAAVPGFLLREHLLELHLTCALHFLIFHMIFNYIDSLQNISQANIVQKFSLSEGQCILLIILNDLGHLIN